MAKRLFVNKPSKTLSREAIRVDATRQQVLSSKLLSDTYDQLKKRYQGTGNSHLISITKDIEKGADPDILVARKDFAFFCEYIDPMFKPALHHRHWHKYLITEQSNKYLHRIAGADLSILSPRGSAKAQPLDAPVLTPNGWVKMGDLAVGDMVIAVDGKPTPITQITKQGVKGSYRVTFSDGGSVECSDDHLWDVRLIGTDPQGTYRTVSLNEIRTQKTVGIKGNWKTGIQRITETVNMSTKPWLDTRGYAKYQIPIVSPVEYSPSDEELLIHPYLMGCLLGDGSLSSGRMIRFTTADQEIVDSFTELLPSTYCIKPVGNARYGYSISPKNPCKGKKQTNNLIDYLDKIGCLGKRSFEKHIPKQYLFASISDRLSLLQGLIDTDGTVGVRNNRGKPCGTSIYFCTTSYQLVLDVQQLVWSLGGLARIGKKSNTSFKDKNGNNKLGRDSWKVSIKLPDGMIPCRLTRKKELIVPHTKYPIARSIQNIEFVGQKEMQCITVADERQLYVTKDFVVTHNSTILGLFLAWAIGIHAEVGKALQILYISANRDIAKAKCETIRNLITNGTYETVFPFVQPNPKKWSNEIWSIDRAAAGIETAGQEEFTMICAGILGSITSKRSAIIGFDDLIKNPDEIATPAIREKMVRTLNYAIYPVLFPGGRKISINTRFRPDDVYVTEFIPAKGWTVLEQSAIIKRRELIQLQTLVSDLERGVEDEEELLKDSSSSSSISCQHENILSKESACQKPNKLQLSENESGLSLGHSELLEQDESYLDEEVSYWEEMWPLSHLDKLRNPETGDPIAFSFQFQNKIASVEGMGIAKEHIKYGHPPDYFDYYCIGCDLAVSKKHSADFTVFVLVGKIDNEFWVLDFWRGKLVGNQPKIEQLLRMYWDYAEDTNDLSLNPYTALQITPWRIAIESVAYQASLQDDLTRELYHKHGLNHIVVMPHKMRGSKTAHVESVSGAFSNGLVTFNMGIDWTIFVKELIGVGGSEHDDCADALVIALQSLGVRKRLATFDEDDKAQAINAYEQRQRELHPMLGSWS